MSSNDEVNTEESIEIGPPTPAAAIVGDEIGIVVGKRERTRVAVTYILLAIFAVIMLYPMLAIPFNWLTVEESGDLLSLSLPGISGILGTAIGFYFGTSAQLQK